MKQILYMKTSILLLAFALLITGASANVLTIESGLVNSTSEMKSMNITIDSVPQGFSGYNISVTVDDPSVAIVDSVTYPAWAVLKDNSTLPSSSCWLKAVDTNDQITNVSTNVILAVITLQPLKGGTTTLLVSPTGLGIQDENDVPYSPTIVNGTFTVNVPVAPTAAFSANVTSGVAPFTVAFTDQSTGSPTSWAWDFDNDGTPDSTLKNPVFTYSAVGTYTVNLTAANDQGSDSEIKTDYITVIGTPIAPVAAFTANTTSGTAPLTVAFTDASTGTAPLTYQWDFTNDGTVDATTKNATHTYPTAGNYTVNLTVTGPGGTDSEVKTDYIAVTEAPVAPLAAFTANTTSGVVPLAVAFTDASTGTEPLTYKWDFNNDGAIDSIDQDPAYTYSSVGTYTVNLTVTGPGGTDSEVKTNYITVTPPAGAPTAAFSANTTSGVAPLIVAFTDASTGTAPLTYAWDLDNNGVIDSTSQNPIANYSTPGTYTVNLTVTNDFGSDSEVKTNYITVTAAPVAPIAGFSANTTSGFAPLTVAFTDASTGTGPLTYQWDFTNNGTVDATTKNATHTYASAGTYTVNLTVTNAAGSDSEVKTNYITVTAAPVTPVAAFSANTTSGVAPLTVAFTDTSTGAVTSWAWDFTNDGTVDATTKNATHTYASAGTYTVNLTVTNAAGSDSEVKTNYITVTTAPVAPVAAFSSNTTSGVAPLTVAFTDASTGTGPRTYQWDFTNDGTIDATTPDAIHTYPSAGTYTVNLTVTNAAGSDSEVKTNYITVTTAPAAPVAAFSANTTSGVAPLTVAFTDASTGTGPLTYTWDFTNDGTVDATTKNATHTYGSAGAFTVNLTVTGPGGTDSEVKTNYISVTNGTPLISAQFTASPVSGRSPLPVRFTSKSTGTITSYEWDFNNDGIVDSRLKDPLKFFTSAGKYTVKLTVRGPDGSDQEIKNQYIDVTAKPLRPIAFFSANTLSGAAPLNVTFTDKSYNKPDTYLWKFGDGTTSTLKNPSHTYPVPGYYKVSLTASNAAGSSSMAMNVYVTSS